MTNRKVHIETIAGLLIFLFVYTAASKLIDFNTFKNQMHGQPLPQYLQSFLVYLVPIAELVISLLLFFAPYRVYGFLLSFGMLSTFTLYVFLILINSFGFVPCSCAGIFNRMSWNTHLIANLVLTSLSLFGLLLERKQRKDMKKYRDVTA